MILCCYRAANPYYYKYAVDGINVFAVSILLAAGVGWEGEGPQIHPLLCCVLDWPPPDLLPLVLVTLVLGYVDSPNHLTGSAVKFSLALLSIMPLSYYIGMAIAR